MTDKSTQKLYSYLEDLYAVNKDLAVKIESGWGTTRAKSLLLESIRERNRDRSITNYKEFSTLMNLYFLHNSLCSDSDADSIESIYACSHKERSDPR